MEPLTRREPVPPVLSLAVLRLPPTIPRSFSGKLVGSFLQSAFVLRCARMVPHHSKFSLAHPSSRPVSGAVYRPFYPCHASVVTLPVNEALHRPHPSCRRLRDRTRSCPGRAPGAPAPCRGCASGPTARLDNAFWPLHRRGLGAPDPAQGEPLWHHAPR